MLNPDEPSHLGIHNMHICAQLRHLLATSFHHVCDGPHPSTSGVGSSCSILENYFHHFITHKLQPFWYLLPQASFRSFFKVKCHVCCRTYAFLKLSTCVKLLLCFNRFLSFSFSVMRHQQKFLNVVPLFLFSP